MAAGIYRRGTDARTWTIVYDAPSVPGRPRNQKSETFKGTHEEAKARRALLVAKAKNGDYQETTSWTVAKLFEEWMKTYAEQQHEVSTYIRNESFIRIHIGPALGTLPLKKLTAVRLDRFYAELREGGRRDGKGLNVHTVRQIHGIISSALRWGVKKKKLPHNVALDTDSLRAKRSEEKRFTPLDEEGIRRLLAATEGTCLHLPVLLAVYTGMRQGEIVALRWEHVDMEAGALTVCRSLQPVHRRGRDLSGCKGRVGEGLAEVRGTVREKGTKTGAPRTVPIPPSLHRELVRVKGEQAEARLALGPIYRNDGWVVAHEDGTVRTPGSIRTAFGRLVRKAGIPTHFHGLRHGYASLLGATGTTPVEAAELLGHKTVEMTFHYTHAQQRRMREAVNRLDEALGRNGTDG